MPRRHDPVPAAAPWLTVMVLAVAGGLLAVGAALHPDVPPAPADQMTRIAASDVWVPAHWGLSIGQPLAVVGLVLLAGSLPHLRGPRGLAGWVLVVVGLSFGTLGTLIAATGTATAAASDVVENYALVAALDLGIGWLGVVITATGGLLLGTEWARTSTGSRRRRVGSSVATGSVVSLLAAAAIPPTHPWAHQYLLRAVAVAMGLVLLGIAAWMAVWARRGEAPT